MYKNRFFIEFFVLKEIKREIRIFRNRRRIILYIKFMVLVKVKISGKYRLLNVLIISKEEKLFICLIKDIFK